MRSSANSMVLLDRDADSQFEFRLDSPTQKMVGGVSYFKSRSTVPQSKPEFTQTSALEVIAVDRGRRSSVDVGGGIRGGSRQ